MKNNQVLIIGAGPAGLSAYLYLTRAGYSSVIYDFGVPGGKVNLTSLVENYPGVEAISGPDLAYRFYEQFSALGGKIIATEVTKIMRDGEHFVVETSEGQRETFAAVIVASGTKDMKLEVEGAARLEHKGLSYCAVCDGPLYKGKDVAVIGGGDAAIEEALYLSTFCASVTLLHRRDQFRAGELLVERLRKSSVKVILNAEIQAVVGQDRVEGLQYRDLEDDVVHTLKVQAVFPYIGSKSNASFVADLHILDEKGYIVTDEHGVSAVPGLFAAGDVRHKELRQIITASGDGAEAAIQAARYLKDHDL